MQRAVPVPADRQRQTLEGAIHAVEHELLPEAIRLIATGKVSVEPGTRLVRIDSAE
jgi:folate-dependent phosphoribosylglycinamide formyltransferase PurN